MQIKTGTYRIYCECDDKCPNCGKEKRKPYTTVLYPTTMC